MSKKYEFVNKLKNIRMTLLQLPKWTILNWLGMDIVRKVEQCSWMDHRNKRERKKQQQTPHECSQSPGKDSNWLSGSAITSQNTPPCDWASKVVSIFRENSQSLSQLWLVKVLLVIALTWRQWLTFISDYKYSQCSSSSIANIKSEIAFVLDYSYLLVSLCLSSNTFQWLFSKRKMNSEWKITCAVGIVRNDSQIDGFEVAVFCSASYQSATSGM